MRQVGMTFNSLFEMHEGHPLDASRSIFFVAFNSLFEMLRTCGLRHRQKRNYAFNSLFEMLFQHVVALYNVAQYPFNSLFEMPTSFVAENDCPCVSLSILYLRCLRNSTSSSVEAPRKLSILYLRCGAVSRPWRRRTRGTFNSLFEMPYS